jgi:hypothetical protein
MSLLINSLIMNAPKQCTYKDSNELDTVTIIGRVIYEIANQLTTDSGDVKREGLT